MQKQHHGMAWGAFEALGMIVVLAVLGSSDLHRAFKTLSS